jgi:hypothetical protein
MIRELYAADRAAFAAFMAAAGAAANLDAGGANPALWPLCGEAFDGEHAEYGDEAAVGAMVVDVLAPFVREHRDAPAEALFRVAGAAGIHPKPIDGFAELGPEFRLAYHLFREALVLLDRWHAEEAVKTAIAEAAEPGWNSDLAVSDSILDTGADATDAVSYVEAERPMTVILGHGKVPGQSTEPGGLVRQAPPAIEDNLQQGADFALTDYNAPLEPAPPSLEAQLAELRDALEGKVAALEARNAELEAEKIAAAKADAAEAEAPARKRASK